MLRGKGDREFIDAHDEVEAIHGGDVLGQQTIPDEFCHARRARALCLKRDVPPGARVVGLPWSGRALDLGLEQIVLQEKRHVLSERGASEQLQLVEIETAAFPGCCVPSAAWRRIR